MIYLIRDRGDGQHELFDRRTGQVLFTGTADQARARQQALHAWCWL